MNKAEFLSKAGIAKAFLAGGDLIPILTHFCFTGDSLTAYNDQQGVVIAFNSEFVGAVPGEFMVRAVNTFSKESFDLIKKGDAAAVLRSGKTNVSVAALTKEEFVFELPSYENPPIVLNKNALTGLKICLTSVSSNPAQIEFNGVTLQINRERIMMYSTNGEALSRYTKEMRIAGIEEGEVYEVIIPSRLCEELVSLGNSFLPEDGEFELFYDDEQVSIKLTDDITLYSRTITKSMDLEFEAMIEKHLPNPDAVAWVPISADFQSAISRAMLICDMSEMGAITEVTLSGSSATFITQSEVGGGTSIDEWETDSDFGNRLIKIRPNLVKTCFGNVSRVAFMDEVIAFANDDYSYVYIVSYED